MLVSRCNPLICDSVSTVMTLPCMHSKEKERCRILCSLMESWCLYVHISYRCLGFPEATELFSSLLLVLPSFLPSHIYISNKNYTWTADLHVLLCNYEQKSQSRDNPSTIIFNRCLLSKNIFLGNYRASIVFYIIRQSL